MGMQSSYSLRQVVELTGLSEFTLRGWENRYAAFKPVRSATGRRRYSAQDLQRAMILRELTRRSHRISDIANLSLSKLNELLSLEGAELSPEAPAQKEGDARVGAVLEALGRRDWTELELILEKVAAQKNSVGILIDFVVPLLHRFGQLVAAGDISIAQEHIISALLKELLYRVHGRMRAPRLAARFLVAAPEGDYHELGILIAHVLASALGARSLYLGPNTPKNELSETAVRFRATHILIGSTVSGKEGAREDLPSYVHFLDRNLPPKVSLWIGGRNARDFRAELGRNLTVLSSMDMLEEQLRALKG